jgi:O-antigen/teichoic acid export membrane protein
MSGKSRRLATDTATSYLRYGIVIIVQLALIPYLITNLGDEGFGLWTLTFSVLGLLSLVDFGFGTSVVRFTAEARGSGDVQRRNAMLSTVLVVYLCLAALAALMVAGVSPFYLDLMKIPESRQDIALPLLWVLAARSIAVSLPFGMFRSILFGHGRIGWVNLLQAGGTLLYAGASVVAIEMGGGLIGLAWANLAAFAVENLAYVVTAMITMPDLRISPRHFDRTLLRSAAWISAAQFVVTVSSLVLLRTDPIIVNAFLPLSAVALYGVALKVAENVLMLIKQGVNVLGPLAAEMSGAGRKDDVRALLVSGAKYALAPAVGMAVAALALGREGLVAWVGPGYGDAAGVLSILMMSVAMLVPQMVASGVFSMTGQHRLTAWAAFLSMTVNVAASLILAWWIGLPGVALGTLIATVLVDVLVVVWLVRRAYGIGYIEYLRAVFVPAAIPAPIAYAAIVGMKILVPADNLGVVLTEAVIGCLLYALVFMALGIGRQERASLRKAFSRE